MTNQPNVVWITLDSVRTDHTSIHGYQRATTPIMERIGANGTVFENCFAHSVATAASTASIFTGTYPSSHGVAMSDSVGTIPDDLRTAAELFRQAGYRTACVTTNPRIELIGADAGFDEFCDVDRSTLLQPKNLPTTAKFLRNLWTHSVGLTTDALRHSFSLVVNDLARRWVESVADEEPFFLYVHYNEPHRPYLPPLAYRDRFVDDLDVTSEEAAELAMDLHENALDYIADGMALSSSEWDAVEAMYDAEIAYADDRLGALLDEIRTTVDDVTVVVTADHGELLGERGIFGHLFEVIDPLVHVPAVAQNFPELTGADDDLVQHADLMKTLLGTAGAPTDQFDGVDLREDTREFTVSQEFVSDYSQYEETNDDFDAASRPVGQIHAIRTREHKLVTSDNGTDLYRLPDETTDVSGEQPEVSTRLADRLDAWLADRDQASNREMGSDDYDERTRRRLSDLGYLE